MTKQSKLTDTGALDCFVTLLLAPPFRLKTVSLLSSHTRFQDRSRRLQRPSDRETNMTSVISTRLAPSLMGLAAATFVSLSGSVSALAQDAVVATLPQDIHFKGPDGAVGIAVLYGDPKKAEVFSERIRIPAGFKIMPHWHGETRTAVVLSGTFYYANGDQWDESKFKAYPPGSFLIEPAKISHYAMAKDGEVVLQAMAVGPASTTRIEQAKQ